MSRMIRATELIGRPVVTLDSATDVAEVKDVVFDPDQSDVAGFALRGRGMLGTPDAGRVGIGDVSAIGRDAIMVPSAAVIATEAASEGAPAGRRDILGDDVVTESGTRIGKVVNLILRVDGGAADVAGYEVEADDSTRSLVPVPDTLAVSASTLMVPDAVERFVTDDLTGFGAAVERFRVERSGGAE